MTSLQCHHTQFTSCLPSKVTPISVEASGSPCTAPERQDTGFTATRDRLACDVRASVPHQRDDEALCELQQMSPQDGALNLGRSLPLNALKTQTGQTFV